MKSAEGVIGRVFVIRLEDGDIVPNCIEEFAADHGVEVGQVILVGGIGGGDVVVGPRESNLMPPEPIRLPIDGAHEVAAVGVLAPGPDGRPALHIHGALGRTGKTTTGCFRHGVSTWMTGECLLFEIKGAAARRLKDEASGFDLLQPE